MYTGDWGCLWLCYTFIDRHPMVVSMVLRARSFRDVCFVSDSVTEPRPGAVIKYNDRQSKNGCLVTSDGCLVTSDSCLVTSDGCLVTSNGCLVTSNGCLVTKVSFPGSCPPMYVSLRMRQLKVFCFPSFEPRLFILDFVRKNAEMYKINQKPGLRFLFA